MSTVQKQELIFSKENATKDQTLVKLSSLVVHLLLSCDSLCIPASKQLNVTVKKNNEHTQKSYVTTTQLYTDIDIDIQTHQLTLSFVHVALS